MFILIHLLNSLQSHPSAALTLIRAHVLFFPPTSFLLSLLLFCLLLPSLVIPIFLLLFFPFSLTSSLLSSLFLCLLLFRLLLSFSPTFQPPSLLLSRFPRYSKLSLQITTSSSNAIIRGNSRPISSLNLLSIPIAKKEGLRADS